MRENRLWEGTWEAWGKWGESTKKKWTVGDFRGLGIDFYQLCQRRARDRRNYLGLGSMESC